MPREPVAVDRPDDGPVGDDRDYRREQAHRDVVGQPRPRACISGDSGFFVQLRAGGAKSSRSVQARATT